ncbi:MAG: TonB-dependent receptor [Candidatus Eremiobacteraeota bacterium]|nr:TonB-dependent receptor [Candidatus Eremiobacteraeota bacterium]
MKTSSLYRIGALFLLSVLLGGPRALAGTTGSLTGTVLDAAKKSPIAGAVVTAASPSQVARVTTDSAGRFTFLSLAPDTYTVSAEHAGYEALSIAGIAVFADQSQVIPMALQPSLKTIARVASRSSLSPVRPGTGTDVYSVNPALTNAAATLGGGGGLNNAYSAIAAMPGAYVPPNQVGVNQTVYIRGGYYDQIGYEYDGVPINRSFDNYPGNSETTLGQQELQIYTGGGEADANATGLGGFINQVIKTGTFPGYATAGGTMGTPTFYHNLQIEAGGSTPDRMFSYYVGIGGTNQNFRYFDQFNGASLTDTIPYGYWPAHVTSSTCCFYPAVYPNCTNSFTYHNPLVGSSSSQPGTLTSDPGCFGSYTSSYGQPSNITQRDVVANFHVGVPHRNDGGRDDVQLLYMSSANFQQDYSSVNDAGPLAIGIINAGFQNDWPDAYTYPGSTEWLAPASTRITAYYYPGSPTERCANLNSNTIGPPILPNSCPNNALSLVPYDYRDGRWDTANIAKIQYQKNLGSTAYVRLFGYTFYSNTNRATGNGYGNNVTLGITNYQYEVMSHTAGLEMQFADQLSGEQLVSGMVSYLGSNTLRYFNHNYNNTSSQQVSNFTNGTQCFAATTGYSSYGLGDPAPCNSTITQGTFGSPYGPVNSSCQTYFTTANPCEAGELPASSPACRAGASMELTYLGNSADINAVAPRITSASLSDEWRPTDRWNVNASVRFENDTYDLANTNDPAKNFWFAAARREFCVNPVTRQPMFVPQPPQSIFVFTPVVAFNCPIDRSTGRPIQTVHPNGTDGILLTNVYPSSYTVAYVEPRLAATYTVDPDTVLRFSAGRYAQQPQNYEIQYNTAEPNLASSLLGFIPFGFDSPLHQALPQFSDNYDFSFEHHFKGTDVAMKLTPYYRWGTNQLYETVNLPSLNVSPSFNAGTLRVDGVELELTKGDFERNGFSGILSYTYTNAAEMWGNYPNSTIGPVDQYNQDIQEFNALTKAGGGALCYKDTANGKPAPRCGPTSILNPYYAMSPQPLLGLHDWYAPGLEAPYISPNTLALVVNYRRGKFAITPSLSLLEGTTYGAPSDVLGLDPRACTNNLASRKLPGNPLSADYTSCSFALTADGTVPGDLFIPNPQTGTFDTFGEFRQPWQLNLGAQVSYDFTPRISGKLMVTNLLNRCFGGSSEPWSQAYPPNSAICGYVSNTFYNGGHFYNGSSPSDKAANGVPENPYFAQSFAPAYGDPFSFNYPLALNFYFSLQVKM